MTDYCCQLCGVELAEEAPPHLLPNAGVYGAPVPLFTTQRVKSMLLCEVDWEVVCEAIDNEIDGEADE